MIFFIKILLIIGYVSELIEWYGVDGEFFVFDKFYCYDELVCKICIVFDGVIGVS